jgi:3-phenylpropionate/cinnamic acid dioxygenase small subunit
MSKRPGDETNMTSKVAEINDLLFRFAASFDEKNWEEMRAILADVIYCDYSSLRGVPPGPVSGADYVEQRVTSLAGLDTQHDLTNVRVAVGGDAATARCNFVIRRFAELSQTASDNFFHSYGHYLFGLRRDAGRWKISAITQVVLRSRGTPDIHRGTLTASKKSF